MLRVGILVIYKIYVNSEHNKLNLMIRKASLYNMYLKTYASQSKFCL